MNNPARSIVLLVLLIFPSILKAEETAANNLPDTPAVSEPEPPADSGKSNNRIFGVLPNYRTVEGSSSVSQLTSKQKLTIAAKDSFDWPTFFITGAFAGIYQAENQNPRFGQGLSGYAKRYGAALSDQVIGNMMTEGFLPVLMHDDPRYFRSGSGTTGSRLKSALLQIIVTRTDAGTRRFNTSEWLGNGIGVGISNLYYSDSRTLSSNIQRLGLQIGNDSLSNVLKEFWPDIKHKFFDRHSS
jgi:hypothetical protein